MAVVTVLLSGGIDSSACVAHYLAQGWEVLSLWVDYGQPAARQEGIAVHNLCRHYGISQRTVRLEGLDWTIVASDPIEYVGRNFTLLSLAVNQSPPASSLVAMGIHGGTGFPDCSSEFVSQASVLVEMISHGKTYFECPFLGWEKSDVVGYAKRQGVPISLTYSCSEGAIGHCGACAKCRERFRVLSEIC